LVPWPNWTCLVETLLLKKGAVIAVGAEVSNFCAATSQTYNQIWAVEIWPTTPPHNEVNYELHSSVYLS